MTRSRLIVLLAGAVAVLAIALAIVELTASERRTPLASPIPSANGRIWPPAVAEPLAPGASSTGMVTRVAIHRSAHHGIAYDLAFHEPFRRDRRRRLHRIFTVTGPHGTGCRKHGVAWRVRGGPQLSPHHADTGMEIVAQAVHQPGGRWCVGTFRGTYVVAGRTAGRFSFRVTTP